MLSASTWQHLRFRFSFFLMPVFWFALAYIDKPDYIHALEIGVLIHFLLYPSSNGYNSYMDRDTESIGGIERPLPITRELYYVSVWMDVFVVAFSLSISFLVACMFLTYVIFSRLYSYRGIRLKKYPFLGYLTVITNQGGLVFLLVYLGCGGDAQHIPWHLVATATLLVGGFYPITQVYQHGQDKRDGVRTISRVLGIRGTFHFCAGVYVVAFGILGHYLWDVCRIKDFIVIQFFFLPIAVLFLSWYVKVFKDEAKADFKHTMRMNLWASTFTNLAFITVMVLHHFQ